MITRGDAYLFPPLLVFAGFEARDSEVQVDVIEGRDVALECALTPGSTPTPAIQWLQCSVCDGSDDAVVVEDLEQNIVRFLDGGQYLLLVASADVIAMEYICQVTNKEKFQTERAPYTYTLSPGEPCYSTRYNHTITLPLHVFLSHFIS